jgi:hypothetical protein
MASWCLHWHHMLTGIGEHPLSTVAGLEGQHLVHDRLHIATGIGVGGPRQGPVVTDALSR